MDRLGSSPLVGNQSRRGSLRTQIMGGRGSSSLQGNPSRRRTPNQTFAFPNEVGVVLTMFSEHSMGAYLGRKRAHMQPNMDYKPVTSCHALFLFPKFSLYARKLFTFPLIQYKSEH